MAIEPLGSVMSVQAQSTVTQQKSAAPAEKTAEHSSAHTQAAPKVDPTTVVVENAQGKGQNTTGEQTQNQQAASQQATNEQIRKAIEQINKKIFAQSEAVFGIHEATNRVTIKIVDKSTKEVIKELPPEKTLDMIAKVWEIAGLLVDEKR